VKSSTPYPLESSIFFLDVCEPMDPDVFNMSVRILSPNALERSKGQ
jgi:hypothetical protein